MVLTEKRLPEIMGPLASFIVETAAQFSSNAGELFAQLAEELSDPAERRYFLSIIETDERCQNCAYRAVIGPDSTLIQS